MTRNASLHSAPFPNCTIYHVPINYRSLALIASRLTESCSIQYAFHPVRIWSLYMYLFTSNIMQDFYPLNPNIQWMSFTTHAQITSHHVFLSIWLFCCVHGTVQFISWKRRSLRNKNQVVFSEIVLQYIYSVDPFRSFTGACFIKHYGLRTNEIV